MAEVECELCAIQRRADEGYAYFSARVCAAAELRRADVTIDLELAG